MYELDGQSYSLEEIEQAAKESNLSLEEYLSAFSDIKQVEEKQEEIEDTIDITPAETNAKAVNEQIAVGITDMEFPKLVDSQNSDLEENSITINEDILTVPQVEDLGLYIDDLIKTRKDHVKLENEEKSI